MGNEKDYKLERTKSSKSHKNDTTSKGSKNSRNKSKSASSSGGTRKRKYTDEEKSMTKETNELDIGKIDEVDDREKIEKELIDVMEMRRKRLEEWKEKFEENKSSSELTVDEPSKTWTLDNEEEEDEEPIESITIDINDKILEVDPLDAYMDEISKEIKGIDKNDSSNNSRSKNFIPEIIEQHQDNAQFAASDDDDPFNKMDLLELSKRKNKKMLEAPDHSKIYYINFRKDFYREVPEISNMTSGEVISYRKKLENIQVRGKGCPRPVKKWSQMGLSVRILDTLKKNNFINPTPIQAQAIPCIMSGRDVIGIAKTGSGKTLAFLIPMFRHILDQPPLEIGDGPIALIMTPTRELALQIYKDCRLFAKFLHLNVTAVYGGNTISEQISALKKGSEIIVCTPGRMIDMLTANNGKIVNCRRVTYFVLDEADRMFDMGFEPQVNKIIEQTRPDRQTILFSATFPRIMESLARRILSRPIEIQVGGRSVVCNDVDQRLIFIEEDFKFFKLLELLGIYNQQGSKLVFVEKQDSADMLLRDLLKKGYPCLSLHGGMDQYDRDSTINDFKNGVSDLLIATSVAARGLDVKNLNLVVNYDCPNHYEDYVHRCGRTGRAGNKGVAVTFITIDDMDNASDIIKSVVSMNIEVPNDLFSAWLEYIDKLKEDGKFPTKRTGFGGKGFTFTEEEQNRVNEAKKMMAWTHGLQDSDDEAEEEEKTLNKIQADIDRAFGNKMQKTTLKEAVARNNVTSVDQSKLSLAQSLASRLNDKLNPANKPAENTVSFKDAASTLLEGGEVGKITLTPMNLAKQIADKINAKINYTASDNPENEEEIHGDYFMEEIDINDFPQQARWKITSKETIASVIELTECAITVKGQYVPPGKTPEQMGTDRRLYLMIESTVEMNLQLAKSELKRILKEELLKLDTSYLRQSTSSRYRVL